MVINIAINQNFKLTVISWNCLYQLCGVEAYGMKEKLKVESSMVGLKDPRLPLM